MSDQPRNWQSAFSPPPPPPLRKAAGAGTDRGRALSAVAPAPSQQDGEGPGADAERPGGLAGERPGSVRHSSTRVPENDSSVGSTISPRDNRRASTLLAALDTAGIEATLIGTRRRSRGPVFDLRLRRPDDLPAALEFAGNYPIGEDVHELRTNVRSDGLDTVIRFELITDPVAGDGKGRRYMVYVPHDVRDAVLATKDSDESITAYFLQAFNAHYQHMGEYFTRRRRIVAGPMSSERAARRRRNVEAPVQMWLFLHPAEIEVLDDAVEDFDAGSRSALITRLFQEEAEARRTGTTL